MSLCRINIYARIRRDIMSTDRGSEYVIYLFIVAPVSGWVGDFGEQVSFLSTKLMC